jgi:hypothetical protein
MSGVKNLFSKPKVPKVEKVDPAKQEAIGKAEANKRREVLANQTDSNKLNALDPKLANPVLAETWVPKS